MTVSTLAAGMSRIQPNQSANRASAVLGSLVDSTPAKAEDAVAKITEAQRQQNAAAPLRQASQNIAQASTLLATLQTGLSQVSKELARMDEQASKAAAPETSDDERQVLNKALGEGRATIDAIAKNTTFNGAPLLDGNAPALKLENAAGSAAAFAPVTEPALFPAPQPAVLSPSGAVIMANTVKSARNYVAEQSEKVTRMQAEVDFAATTVEVATQNQDAARSSLSDEDVASLLAAGSTNGAVASSAAQVNRLPGNILQLLAE